MSRFGSDDRVRDQQQAAPRRRNKRAKSISELIEENFSREFPLLVNGERRRVTTLEIILWRLWEKKEKGDKRAAKVLLGYIKLAAPGGDTGVVVEIVNYQC